MVNKSIFPSVFIGFQYDTILGESVRKKTPKPIKLLYFNKVHLFIVCPQKVEEITLPVIPAGLPKLSFANVPRLKHDRTSLIGNPVCCNIIPIWIFPFIERQLPFTVSLF